MSLPVELLSSILQFIESDPSDIAAVAQVCREWRFVCLQVQETVRLHRRKKLHCETLVNALQCRTLLQKIDLCVRNTRSIVTPAMLGALSRCTSLEHLRIAPFDPPSTGSTGLFYEQSMSRFEAVTQRCPFVSRFLQAELPDHLTARPMHIAMHSSQDITTAGLVTLLTVLPSLQTLRLWGFNRITDDVLCGIASNCRGLQELSIEPCHFVSASALYAFSRLTPQLRQLKLSHTDLDDRALLGIGLSSSQLQRLCIARTYVAHQLASFDGTPHQMTDLVLDGCDPGVITQLPLLFRSCKSLTSLTLIVSE